MTKKSKSSGKWLARQRSDEFTQLAKKEGRRSRAYYKLLEMHKKHDIIRKGMFVVDLGAAPGGWSELASELVGSTGKVYALDLLPIEPIGGVEIIQGDFTEESVYSQLLKYLDGNKCDLVISDMAPNLSGIKSVDIPKAFYLAELALDFAFTVLKNDGSFITKVFQGEGFDAFLTKVRTGFNKVRLVKPKASRDESKEVYILADGYHA